MDNWHGSGRKVGRDQCNIVGIRRIDPSGEIAVCFRQEPPFNKLRNLFMDNAEAGCLRDLLNKQLTRTAEPESVRFPAQRLTVGDAVITRAGNLASVERILREGDNVRITFRIEAHPDFVDVCYLKGESVRLVMAEGLKE